MEHSPVDVASRSSNTGTKEQKRETPDLKRLLAICWLQQNIMIIGYQTCMLLCSWLCVS